MNFRFIIPVLLLLVFASPVFAQECTCALHEEALKSLARMVDTHRQVFQTAFQPCEGRANLTYYMVPVENRARDCPEFAECLKEAQAAMFEVIRQEIQPRKGLLICAYLVRKGFVISKVCIDSEGDASLSQGEPDYGFSRELRDYQQDHSHVIDCGLGFVSCSWRGGGFVVAKSFDDPEGAYLGEVQLSFTCPPQKNLSSAKIPSAGFQGTKPTNEARESSK